ncbi:MAG: thioredoxin-like 4B [Olpidium bornovanus]|uniref:Thioredoxin-like 4B n=1 Tax=Olpidium bornovanus TaxID=278681 RepID=A0A8H7ZS75_9FUNG|nr:MAG: thioredoxin-like 4B [Olpidium bornovanus]
MDGPRRQRPARPPRRPPPQAPPANAAASALPTLRTKADVDAAILTTEDRVLALRFGRQGDPACLATDNVVRLFFFFLFATGLEKAAPALRRMAAVCLVDVDAVPEYASYFEIEFIPSTVFFFNAHHVKVDCGTPDHTKFVGPVATKQDFIDLVETVYRGAMRGKPIVDCPIDPARIPRFELYYGEQ